MERDEILSHLHRLLAKVRADETIYGTHSEVCEFLRVHIGPKSAFLQAIGKIDPHARSVQYTARDITQNLTALIASIEAGAHAGLSPKRQAELDVVSDFLGMANQLLEAYIPQLRPCLSERPLRSS